MDSEAATETGSAGTSCITGSALTSVFLVASTAAAVFSLATGSTTAYVTGSTTASDAGSATTSATGAATTSATGSAGISTVLPVASPSII